MILGAGSVELIKGNGAARDGVLILGVGRATAGRATVGLTAIGGETGVAIGRGTVVDVLAVEWF